MKTRRRRILDRKYPAPPPTPEGMVWQTRHGITKLYRADDLQKECQNSMGDHDYLPDFMRRAAFDPPPEKGSQDEKNRANARLASIGIGLA